MKGAADRDRAGRTIEPHRRGGLPGSAAFSACGTYRYRLDRHIGGEGPIWTFVLHNPSTADGETDDPTLRRGVGFVRRWGGRHLIYVNRFAARARDPLGLWQLADPVGPDNDRHIASAAREARDSGGGVVIAWGGFGRTVRLPIRERVARRSAAVLALLREVDAPLYALAVANDGTPKHPLYLRGELTAFRWGSVEAAGAGATQMLTI
jgi:hypothetical protein